ncbi:MAG: hypothetical protein Q9222_003121 [Ikaeria aurantiellina]
MTPTVPHKQYPCIPSPLRLCSADNARSNSAKNTSTSSVADEFTGLLLRPIREPGDSLFTTESVGLFAIAALKEEALKDYTDPVFDYGFIDYEHPDPPLDFSIRAETEALLHEQVRRSTVMWTINTLALDMMRNRYLHRLAFTVNYFLEHLYTGVIDLNSDPTIVSPQASPPNNQSLSSRALTANQSLTMKITHFANHRMALSPSSSSFHDDHPSYSLSFRFNPSPSSRLPEYETLKSLLATLLQLAKLDAASIQPLIEMATPESGVWVFMRESVPPAPNADFQQYHAVAIVEAMARYFQLQGQHREMTFTFSADGRVVGTGCVTRNLQWRRWCQGMPKPDAGAVPGGGDQNEAVS